jgi:polar amino acid transport system substrate-binding protein
MCDLVPGPHAALASPYRSISRDRLPRPSHVIGIECQRVNNTTSPRRAILGAVLIFTGVWLSACGGAGGLGAAGKFTPGTPGTLTVATAQVPDPGFWSGTVRHPTGGFEYGLARALAARFGLAKVRVIEVPFKRLTAGYLGGADLALSDITVTAERSQHLDFSTPYLSAPPAILVRPGTEVPDVHSAQGLRWAVENGTTLLSALKEAIEPSTAPQILEHQREVLLALRVGRAEAVMLDLPVALAYARELPHTYAVAAQLPSEDVLAAALPKGSENLEAVNSAMHALSADGTIERLGREWLDTDLQGGHDEQVPVLRTDE